MSLLTKNRAGFPSGLTTITSLDDPSGIALSVWKPEAAGQKTTERETAWLLLSGAIDFTAGGQSVSLARRSLFDEPPCAFHVSAGTEVRFAPKGACEVLGCEAQNAARFAPKAYVQVKDEHRGKGKVHDASYRFVRTVFDGTNAPPEAVLVLGEVVNFPGRWSSYPPHHHPQPELYHYRFDKPDGYGTPSWATRCSR